VEGGKEGRRVSHGIRYGHRFDSIRILKAGRHNCVSQEHGPHAPWPRRKNRRESGQARAGRARPRPGGWTWSPESGAVPVCRSCVGVWLISLRHVTVNLRSDVGTESTLSSVPAFPGHQNDLPVRAPCSDPPRDPTRDTRGNDPTSNVHSADDARSSFQEPTDSRGPEPQTLT